MGRDRPEMAAAQLSFASITCSGQQMMLQTRQQMQLTSSSACARLITVVMYEHGNCTIKADRSGPNLGTG
jgi:hypothetical protein